MRLPEWFTAPTLVLAVFGVFSGAAESAPRGALNVEARPGPSYETAGVRFGHSRSGFAAVVWKTAPSANQVVELRSATRAPGGAWSRPATLVRVSTRRAALFPMAVAVDERGGVRALWGERKRGAWTVGLKTAARARAGHWRPATALGTASFSGLLGFAPQGGLGVSADGTATAAWCEGGDSDNVLDTTKPGTVFARSAGPDARWSRVERLWTGRACAGTDVQVNRRGDAIATWYTEQLELDDAQLLAATRPTGGHWSAQPQRVPEIAGGSVVSEPRTLLAEDGTIRLLAATGENGTEGIRYGSMTLDGVASDPEVVPTPSPTQTFGGWIGAGTLAGGAFNVDSVGVAVSVFGTNAESLPQDGGTASALWAASRSQEGRWSLAPLDDLAEASDPVPYGDWPAPSLQTDDAGRIVATWTVVGTTSPCRLETFRSVRSPEGAWSRRVLVGQEGGNGGGGSCDIGRGIESLPPPASILWKATSRKLQVIPAPRSSRTGSPPRVRLRTKTWASIRRAGAIEFSCRTRDPGLCHLSLIAGEHDENVFDALEGFCRPSQGSVWLTRASQSGVVRFPLARGCYDGGPLPNLRTKLIRVPVFAVADAVGRRSAERRFNLTIGSR